MIEYDSKRNRFPFYRGEKMASITMDDHEESNELDIIYSRSVERFPALDAGPFYAKIGSISAIDSEDECRKCMKVACDNLLKNIRSCIGDEQFIHSLHDDYGFGV